MSTFNPPSNGRGQITVSYQPSKVPEVVSVNKDLVKKKQEGKEREAENKKQGKEDINARRCPPKGKDLISVRTTEGGDSGLFELNWLDGGWLPKFSLENELSDESDKNFLLSGQNSKGSSLKGEKGHSRSLFPINPEEHLRNLFEEKRNKERKARLRKREGDWISALLLGCGGFYIFPEGEKWMFIQCNEGETNEKIRELVEKTRLELNESDEGSAVTEALLKHVFLWNSEDKEEILKKALET
ncbi:hypothetical protein MHSWG343_09320 [Candidatus Mycoplasma haematohominis]|uniref:Uncharacterized protein n=1 Tax=Candidatus Mycoplasma haematohominis TaxID=1494318 RepID=A0A478FUX4_9MOLU|nr:hypothetical protein MHSWG343_09320 [Candidatus Mycoplasma haemohominis]